MLGSETDDRNGTSANFDQILTSASSAFKALFSRCLLSDILSNVLTLPRLGMVPGWYKLSSDLVCFDLV